MCTEFKAENLNESRMRFIYKKMKIKKIEKSVRFWPRFNWLSDYQLNMV